MRRRELLGSAAALGLLAACSPSGVPATKAALADGPLETTTIRLAQLPSTCIAPQYLAEEFLKAEGFTDVRYVKTTIPGLRGLMTTGEIDVSMNFAATYAMAIDQGAPVAAVSGVHSGCFEIVAADGINSLRDLKGKTMAYAGIPKTDDAGYLFLASILAHVGLDIRTDVKFAERTFAQVIEQLPQGKVDAFLAFSPQPQELRAKKIGHVLFNSLVDQPWSRYFCCVVTASRDFIAKNPVATLRATRAILKGNDQAVADPERSARFLVDRGYAASYEYALATIAGSRGTGSVGTGAHAGHFVTAQWNDVDPEDTLRFYALRLHEVELVKGTPERIIADGIDRRFLDKLRKDRN